MWRAVSILLVLVIGCRHPFDPVEAAHVQSTALAVGASAPSIQLTSTSNATVALADIVRGHSQTIVVFYRGFY